MDKKAFAAIWIFGVVVAALILIGGVFYYTRPVIAPEAPINASSTGNPISTSSAPTSTTAVPPAQTWSLSPKSGPVGTVVTISGSNFGATSTVQMNSLVSASMKNISSAKRNAITFTVPGTLGPDCDPDKMCAQFLVEVTPRDYAVTVLTRGLTQNVGTFTVMTAPAH